MLGVELAKGETRSNWLRRPLSSAQLHYAAADVQYLYELYLQLADELEARNPGLKVVFMSGYSEEIVGGRLSAEHRVLLEKPFSLPTLLERVGSVMEG